MVALAPSLVLDGYAPTKTISSCYELVGVKQSCTITSHGQSFSQAFKGAEVYNDLRGLAQTNY